ncbi:MAG: dipeptide/oligopeptide/nickel ABC transporter permease/ATP-binding protein [Solirubrobacterales bacterium]|jgi:peptide/nickel transport system ATP-binding protein|nr:dipeptide/oligopeptide/nickel ABC transporter permease/ATP-binding protein [Solirubrobacterales bacterium]
MTRSGRRIGFIGAGLLVVVALGAILAPLLAANGPSELSGAPFQSPSAEFPLGTDDVGHDLFAQLLYGARVSLAIGLISATVATVIGLGIAFLAGYARGRAEAPLMRVVDLALAFPFFVLVIVLAAFLGRDLLITAAVISSVLWAEPARVLYSDVIKVREFEHVLAARGMGASSARVVTRHVLPRLAPLAVSQFVRTANTAIFLESALAFLGLGDPNRVSWGSMLFYANSRSAFLTDAWVWWILPPGLALTAVLVGLAFLGYAIEERADPRLSGRRGRGAGRRPPPTASPTTTPAPAPQAAGTVLEVRDLSVAYRTGTDEVRAVDGVSFAVGQRSVVGLVGESGSGKSSLALALLGLLRPPGRVLGGEIMLNGRDLRTLRGPEAGRVRGQEVALVPQGAMSALNPAYTVHRQVAEVAALTREDRHAAQRRASEVLEDVGIAAARHGAFPHELSGGMRQRVTIAMAVANEPSLVVADEPVTGLDVVTQAKILALLLELRDRLGLTLVLISHDLRLAARVSDELLVMQEGRVVESGATDTLTACPRHPHTRALLAASPGLRELERRS